ncbi:uncharacterized protein LOC107485782 [Arachis duranensis]|uniref:Uncharacterized protein LOC107485782 n=1 Tax=Arachis duranensis TaxID=130453 RepID=A0A9C6TWD8_ARADU|nr:uncharacterized protein LOC107485782 [Arachis duranensis]
MKSGAFAALFVAGGRSSRSWGSSSSCFESRRQPPSRNQKLLHDLGKGDGEELKSTAIHCLCRLRGQAVDESAHRQVDEILAELAYVGEEKEVIFGEIFREKCLKALTIGAGLVLFQQITGQPNVLQYAGSILQDSPLHLMQPESLFSLVFSSYVQCNERKHGWFTWILLQSAPPLPQAQFSAACNSTSLLCGSAMHHCSYSANTLFLFLPLSGEFQILLVVMFCCIS